MWCQHDPRKVLSANALAPPLLLLFNDSAFPSRTTSQKCLWPCRVSFKCRLLRSPLSVRALKFRALERESSLEWKVPHKLARQNQFKSNSSVPGHRERRAQDARHKQTEGNIRFLACSHENCKGQWLDQTQLRCVKWRIFFFNLPESLTVQTTAKVIPAY